MMSLQSYSSSNSFKPEQGPVLVKIAKIENSEISISLKIAQIKKILTKKLPKFKKWKSSF